VTVPCDSPNFPADLVARLAERGPAKQAEIAMAATLEDGRVQRQPVFCLLQAAEPDGKPGGLPARGRTQDRPLDGQHRCIEVVFDDAQAFANANTLEELQRLQNP
jgi:molybdopterin-guanine dinucleotide biosynthesis protein A